MSRVRVITLCTLYTLAPHPIQIHVAPDGGQLRCWDPEIRHYVLLAD